jgi:hypothetical protein
VSELDPVSQRKELQGSSPNGPNTKGDVVWAELDPTQGHEQGKKIGTASVEKLEQVIEGLNEIVGA